MLLCQERRDIPGPCAAAASGLGGPLDGDWTLWAASHPTGCWVDAGGSWVVPGKGSGEVNLQCSCRNPGFVNCCLQKNFQ